MGEAVVSGTVTPDTYWVDKATGEILRKQISEKKHHVPEEI
nr:PEP/pyruvate-binding domain-containing protein [Methanobacterium formicicum]